MGAGYLLNGEWWSGECEMEKLWLMEAGMLGVGSESMWSSKFCGQGMCG